MILRTYAFFDTQANAFSTPFFAVNDDIAIRSFTRLVNDSSTMLCFNPENFALYCLSSFDIHSGAFVLMDTPSLVMHAVDVFTGLISVPIPKDRLLPATSIAVLRDLGVSELELQGFDYFVYDGSKKVTLSSAERDEYFRVVS